MRKVFVQVCDILVVFAANTRVSNAGHSDEARIGRSYYPGWGMSCGLMATAETVVGSSAPRFRVRSYSLSPGDMQPDPFIHGLAGQAEQGGLPLRPNRPQWSAPVISAKLVPQPSTQDRTRSGPPRRCPSVGSSLDESEVFRPS